MQNSLAAREDIIYETVFSHPSKLELIRQARAFGYFVRLFFICTDSPRINVSRVAKRFASGGHDVPGDKVTQRYHRSLRYGAQAMRLVQRGYLFDNSIEAEDEQYQFHPVFRTIDGCHTKIYMPVEEMPASYRFFLEDYQSSRPEDI